MPTFITNLPISIKMLMTFVVILVISLALNIVSFLSTNTQEDATKWTVHTYEVLSAVDEVVASMVNQETGVRGYLLAGDETFLEPQRAGAQQFEAAFKKAKSLTSDNPVQQARFDELLELVKGWQTDIAGKEIALMGNPATVDQARAMEIGGAGKSYMDAIRAKAAQIAEEEAALLDSRTEASVNAAARTRAVLIVGLIAMIGVVFASMLAMNALITKPIRRITDSMSTLADGDLSVDVPFAERRDEVGLMAGAVEVFRQNGLKARSLEAEANSTRETMESNRRAEQERIEREAAQLQIATSALGESLKRLAGGDLTCRIETSFAQEYEGLRSDFNATVEQLRAIVTSLNNAVASMESGTQEISAGSTDLSQRTERQAAALEETASALEQITANVGSSSKLTQEARGVAQAANKSAVESAEVVSRAETAMASIEHGSQEISKIIGVIDEIAFQTNLLALNAGVEAARAGEAGKGFAVVAQEVRELAQRSAEAAKEIKGLILESTGNVEDGVKLVRDAGNALNSISEFITQINGQMNQIASSANEQATGLSEINQAINEMDRTTQQNAAMVEESTAAVASLADEAVKLRELISQFRVETRSEDAGAPSNLAEKVAGSFRRSAAA